VANTAPTATITAPGSAVTWKVGDKIAFSGTATDPEQGALPASALTWTLVMQHCPSDCHAHQITTMTGASGTFTAPDHEYPSHLELRLTATDAGGLTDTKTVRLNPKTAGLTFASQPTGLPLTYLATTARAPFTRTAIVGSGGSMSSAFLQLSANQIYRFSSWSDGGTRTHNFVTPAAPTTYTANYRAKRNLALNRPVTVSSSTGTTTVGPKAVDGSLATAWTSASADPQRLQIDLGMVHSVNRVLLNWAAAYGKAYTIQVSTNGTTWRSVYSTTTGDGGTDLITFTAGDARYVRIDGTARGTTGGYSLAEVGVFGDTGVIAGVAGKCVDVYKALTANGTAAILWTCHSGVNQRWTQLEDGTFRTMGKCLDARGTVIRTGVVLWTCDGSGGQKWLPRPDGTLLNVRSGRCLDAMGGYSTNGTKLIIYDCHTRPNQQWVLP
jgi:hypothetical protein